MKIDLRKAYDSVSWKFIEELLMKLKFTDKFRKWIITCITTPTFSLSINGCLVGFLKGRKGLRQGDPISPLLFVLVMEYFSRILQKVGKKENFGFHHRCKELRLNHLIFADDLMLFCKGDIQSVTLMVRALKAFSDAAGLQANQMKSAIYFGNVQEEIRSRILQVTGFQSGSFPFRYLGVPITSKRISISDCDVLIDRMLKRILCWSSRHLSYAGRATLVNVVLLSIHCYWAQVFLLPKYVIQRVTQICRAYLWDGKTFIHKPSLVVWDWVCRPKKCGGLGVRDCMVWNTAGVGKYIWQIAKKEDTLWIKWVHSIYICEANWWEYNPPSTASWAWKMICRVKEKLKPAYQLNLWLGGRKAYTIQEGYQWLKGDMEKVRWHHWVWSSMNIPKHSYIAWLAAWGRLNTRERLNKAGICRDTSCLLCDTGIDSCQHLFFKCEFSRRICKGIMNWLKIYYCGNENMYVHWRKWGRKFQRRHQQKVAYASLAATIYYIWKAGNHALWHEAVWIPEATIKKIQCDIISRVKAKICSKWSEADCQCLLDTVPLLFVVDFLIVVGAFMILGLNLKRFIWTLWSLWLHRNERLFRSVARDVACVLGKLQDITQVDSQLLASLPCFNNLRFLHSPEQNLHAPSGFLGVHLGTAQSSSPQYVITFDAAWKKETKVMGGDWNIHSPSSSMQFIAKGGGTYGLASSSLHAESHTFLQAL
ncbi:uncharacterized protein LOC125491683 [Beta vulgaris subsp. vulgaris]|uniref:uncharacterized protein LOC125491683 n=1 Tax=Beta vulgaris subsp. vulgaris TaxID=3555 RepID=UPI002036B7D5|nr:uncharacterized protein LOC125491683 [Beta vulgaris subsp. vulgaris]